MWINSNAFEIDNVPVFLNDLLQLIVYHLNLSLSANLFHSQIKYFLLHFYRSFFFYSLNHFPIMLKELYEVFVIAPVFLNIAVYFLFVD